MRLSESRVRWNKMNLKYSKLNVTKHIITHNIVPNVPHHQDNHQGTSLLNLTLWYLYVGLWLWEEKFYLQLSNKQLWSVIHQLQAEAASLRARMVILERDVALLNERLDSNEASTIPDQLLPPKKRGRLLRAIQCPICQLLLFGLENCF
jgi:cell division protein FtsB